MEYQSTHETPDISSISLSFEPAITSRSLANLLWELRWHSESLTHIEEFFTPLNIWRDLDLCPAPLAHDLPGKKPGDTLTYHSGQLL